MKVLGNIVRYALVAAAIAAAVFFLGRFIVALVGSEPIMLGMNPDTERGGCPGTPNCVSSFATTPEHAIEPIECSAPEDVAIAAFADAMNTLPDVERRSDTAWVVYSRIFRFPDDVSIRVSARGIEVYSASRLGAGDLGVNRNRMETMRELLAEDVRCG